MKLEEALQTRFSGELPKDACSPICVAPLVRDHGRPALASVMGDLGFTSGIEIGTRGGHSAQMWLSAMPNLHLTCIDPYQAYDAIDSQRRADRHYARAQEVISGYNAEIIRKPSGDVPHMFEDESVDFVYIDGDHKFDAVMMDLIFYVKKVRRGGIIALHDYFRIRGGGVMDAVDAYTRTHGIDPWYVTFDFAPTAFWQRGSEKL